MMTLRTIANATVLLLFWGVSVAAYGQEWREEPPLPQAVYSMAAVAAQGDIYIAGGRNGRGTVSNALFRYDVERGEWEAHRAPMEEGRYFAAAAVLNGKIFVIGGRDDDDEVLESVEIFDLRSQTWNEAGDLEEARYGHTAIVLDGNLYVLGGADEDGDILESVERYDADDDEWKISDRWKLDQPRAAFATARIGRSAYSFGGINRVPLPHVQRFGFDEGSGVLTPPPGHLEARAFFAAVAVGDSIYVIGGRGNRDRALDDVVLFVPSEAPGRQFQKAPRLRTARDSFGAVEVNGTVYVIGGRDSEERVLSSVESFSPRSTVAAEDPLEAGFELEQNHPNPFTISTRISFRVGDAAGRVQLEIFDLQGRLLHRAIDGYLPPGRHELEWNGEVHGRSLPSGVYFYVLRQDGLEQTKMMTRIR